MARSGFFDTRTTEALDCQIAARLHPRLDLIITRNLGRKKSSLLHSLPNSILLAPSGKTVGPSA